MNRKPLDPGSPGADIVAEEQGLLDRVRALLARRARAASPAEAIADYDSELIALRDEVAEAKPEDLAPLVEQMTRVAALAASHRRELALPVDPGSPYFAHLRLRESARPPRGARPGAPTGERTRDVLIGRRGLIDRASGVQVVDWRDAPVSRIYYRYEEGDDYDEDVEAPPRGPDSAHAPREAGAPHLVGVVEARRNLSIQGGHLRRVGCPLGVFVADAEGRWYEAEGQATPTLAGGQGKAARPPRATGPRGVTDSGGRPRPDQRRLGVHGGAIPRADKHLPEIAALIDRHQFELITEPSSGLVLIQGGAGSGKTTVALHRVAYLVFQDPAHFRPSRCMVIVPSLALERYVAGVLPALGVRGVSVTTARGWARSTRRRVLPHVSDRYTDDTPSVVSRVKKHPALLATLERYVEDLGQRLGEELAAAPRDRAAQGEVRAAWAWHARSAPAERVSAMRRWLPSSGLDGLDAQRLELAITRVRRRARDVASAWAEVLTDYERLRAGLPPVGADAVRDGELREVVAWSAAQQDGEAAHEEWDGIDPEAREPVDGGELDDSVRGRAAGRLDAEDDPLLLRLAQLLLGGLVKAAGQHGKEKDPAIHYDHLAIDEAQDLSAIELRVLVDAAGERRSVTIAGDVAQRLVFDNGFRGWDELLADLRLSGAAHSDGARAAATVRPLSLSYRSTEEVMRFARAVLGPLAGEEQPARPGAPVELHRFESMGVAVAFLAEALRSLEAREPTASVALIARHPAQADAYHAALARAEVPMLRRVRRQDFAFSPGIDVTDVAQVKGLEFDYVVLLDVTAESYPGTVEARHLLHIGATRAAHQLWLISVGAPSPLVPPELTVDG